MLRENFWRYRIAVDMTMGKSRHIDLTRLLRELLPHIADPFVTSEARAGCKKLARAIALP